MPVRAIFELPEGFDQLGQTQLKDLCIRLEAGIKEIKKEREEDAKSLIAIKQSLGDCEKLLDKTKVELNSHKLDAERLDSEKTSSLRKYELLKTSYNEKEQLLKEAEKTIDKFREDLTTLNSKVEKMRRIMNLLQLKMKKKKLKNY